MFYIEVLMMEREFKVYLLGDRECFEYTSEIGQQTKKDLAFAQSLLDWLYLDIWPYADLLYQAGDDIQELRESRRFETGRAALEKLQALTKAHFYFELVRLDWERRIEKVGDQSYDELFRLLPYKRVSHIPSETQTLQSEVKDLIENVLDILSEEPVQKKLVDYAHERRSRRSRLVSTYRFSKLTTTFEQVDEGHFAEVLRPNSIDEIIEFFVRACVQREQRFRVCKNCGKYFALSGYTNTEYCDRLYENTGKTCKEIGALNTWQKKRTENPVINAYSKAYKKRFAWIRYHKITKEIFYEWSEEARKMRDKCLKGEISLEEYKEWLSK